LNGFLVKPLESPPQIRHNFVMTNTRWKKGKKLSFPVRDGYGNDINFRLDCQLDKGNKRFVLRWQGPTDLDLGKIKNINPAYANSSPSYLIDVNGTLFFLAGDYYGRELWKIKL